MINRQTFKTNEGNLFKWGVMEGKLVPIMRKFHNMENELKNILEPKVHCKSRSRSLLGFYLPMRFHKGRLNSIKINKGNYKTLTWIKRGSSRANYKCKLKLSSTSLQFYKTKYQSEKTKTNLSVRNKNKSFSTDFSSDKSVILSKINNALMNSSEIYGNWSELTEKVRSYIKSNNSKISDYSSNKDAQWQTDFRICPKMKNYSNNESSQDSLKGLSEVDNLSPRFIPKIRISVVKKNKRFG